VPAVLEEKERGENETLNGVILALPLHWKLSKSRLPSKIKGQVMIENEKRNLRGVL
jgi:hypothetical protein